ncbi:MAG: hypothetical protein AABZ30_13215 [Myxococcota bacterium]
MMQRLVCATLLLAACGDDPRDQERDLDLGAHVDSGLATDGGGDAALDAPAAPDGAFDAGSPPDAEPDGGPPECDDGIDNDGDDNVDLDDEACSDPGDPDESNDCSGLAFEFLEGAAVSGTVTSGAGYASGTCAPATANERVFAFDLEQDAALTLSTDLAGTDHDTAIYLRERCLISTEVACANTVGTGETVTTETLPAGRYFIFVDGGAGGQNGDFELTVRVLIAEGGECEPGNEVFVCGDGLVCSDDGACVDAACSDGEDDDDDGLVDLAEDPGCGSASDDDENDPDTAPACANDEDDDADGDVDFPSDPGCAFPGDDDEEDQCIAGVPLLHLEEASVSGNTSGATDEFSGTCLAGVPSGPERVYALDVPGEADVTLSIGHVATGSGATVYVRTDCPGAGSEIGCSTYWGEGSGGGALAFDDLDPGRYFVFVDNYYASSTTYTLTVAGTLAPGSSCTPADPIFVCGGDTACEVPEGGDETICTPLACSDGVDNDGDDALDAADVGCVGAFDPDEADTGEETACSNGEDDDGDGEEDFGEDEGCEAAGDDSEVDECGADVPVVAILSSIVSGETVSPGTFTGTGACAVDSSAGERIFALDVPGTADVTLTVNSTSTSFPMLYVRSACTTLASQIACDGSPPATVTLADAAAGRYYVFVDGWYGTEGEFTLSTSGTLAQGEPCALGDPIFSCAEGTDCVEPLAGVGFQCAPEACADGFDNDLDSDTDMADLGCADFLDDDETDPDIAPECSNGDDDDADGETDFPNDPGCLGPGDVDESDECGAGVSVENVTATGEESGVTFGDALYGPTCFSSGSSPEDIFVLDVPARSELYVSTAESGTEFNTGLYLRTLCTDSATEVECANPASTATGDRVVWHDVAPGRYFLFVDGVGGGVGAYGLRVRGLRQSGEPCAPDDLVFPCGGGLVCDTVCRPTACANAIDDDDDGATDFTQDDGCGGPLDDDESDAVEGECADGGDGDGDGLIDDADPGCEGPGDPAEGPDCGVGLFVKDITATGQVDGTTSGSSSNFNGTGSCSLGGAAPERVFLYHVAETSDLVVSSEGSAYNAAIYVRASCLDPASQMGCADTPGAGSDLLFLDDVEPGEYFVVLDGVSGASGAFNLTVTRLPR